MKSAFKAELLATLNIQCEREVYAKVTGITIQLHTVVPGVPGT